MKPAGTQNSIKKGTHLQHTLLATVALTMTLALSACSSGESDLASSSSPSGATTSAPLGAPAATIAPQGSPSARLQALLADETERYQRDGLELTDVFEGSLDGENEHVAALYASVEDLEGRGYLTLLVIYEVQSGKLVSLLHERSVYPVVSQESPSFSAIDLDGDGLDELVVRIVTGYRAFPDSDWLEIFTVMDHQASRIPFDLPLGATPKEVKDIDGDGRWEVVALDTRWEERVGQLSVDWGCHYCAPMPNHILAWRDESGWPGGRYVEASADFPEYYQAVISELAGELQTLQSSDPLVLDQRRASLAVSLLLNYDLAGEGAMGWKTYREVMAPDKLQTDEWRARIDSLASELADMLELESDAQQDTRPEKDG